ncbi:recombination and repair protein RecT [Anoxybacillus sp. BCO1]|nr:recombination and repair protein RecT [Anoxybacillus sp. BCO1]
MATNQTLKTQLANKAKNTEATPPSPAQTIAAYLKKMGPEIEKALPKHMDADRMARIALTTIRTNPKLLECSVPSLLGAVMQAAQLGLSRIDWALLPSTIQERENRSIGRSIYHWL